jgi:hypothetical protein
MDEKTFLLHSSTLTYQCAPSIIWATELDQILVIDRERSLSWSIQGVEATIWDLLVAAYPHERIVYFLALLLDVPAMEAEKVLSAAIQSWHDRGILEISGRTVDGESGY